jgi:hypothetical protein
MTCSTSLGRAAICVVEVVIYRRPPGSSPGGLMLVQRVLMPDSSLESWTVLSDEGGIVEPIERYLAYLTDIERSPNTVKAYAHDLKDWFVFLERRGLDWHEVRLGDPPSPLPEPVADLMRAYMQSCQHLPYASSRSSQWLFPGRQPGQPMDPVSLQVHLREIGVPRNAVGPLRSANSSSRPRHPSSQKALGYHDKTATRLVTEAGGTWSRYAAGDHERRR